MNLQLFLVAGALAILVAAVDRRHQQPPTNEEATPTSRAKKDDVVERICKSDPDFMFCKQYMRGEMGEASMVPFPHLSASGPHKEGEKKRFLIIKNEFYPNGTVKIPPNVTLDAKNERELAQIKHVDHRPFQVSNNWGFEEAPPLKPDDPLLPEPSTQKNKTALEAGDSETNEKENFDFELPKPQNSPENVEIRYPANLPSTHPVADERTGLLSGVGAVNVGYGIGVPVPGSPDGVSVGGKVGVGLGGSGPAWKIPYFFNNQGEYQSLNDYDGNKLSIVPDRAIKYYRYQVWLARESARQKSQLIDASQLSTINKQRH